MQYLFIKVVRVRTEFWQVFLKFGILILDSTINVGAKYQSFLQHSFREIK